jgi:hypothetical protein
MSGDTPAVSSWGRTARGTPRDGFARFLLPHVLLRSCGMVLTTGIGEWCVGALAVDDGLALRSGAGPADGCQVLWEPGGLLDELVGPLVRLRLGLLAAPNGVLPTIVPLGPLRETVRLCFIGSRSSADTTNVGQAPLELMTGRASA